MHCEPLKRQAAWLAMVAAILFSGAVAQAESGKEPAERELDPPQHERHYWIGLAIEPLTPRLRDELELKEESGVLVDRVAPDGPADKAGIVPDDVLLKAGDKELKTVRDLVDVVAGSEGKAISIALVHNGNKKTVEVTPEQRAERGPRGPRGEGPPGPPLADRLFRVLRPGLPVDLEFPKDVSVTIQKSGNEPGKVVVTRGDKKWEVTDKTLGQLPDEVRGYVEMYLGKMPTPPLPPEVEEQLSRALPLPPGLPEDIEGRIRREAGRYGRRLGEEALPRVRDFGDRLQEVERRLEQRLRDIEKRLDEDRKPAPEKPESDKAERL